MLLRHTRECDSLGEGEEVGGPTLQERYGTVAIPSALPTNCEKTGVLSLSRGGHPFHRLFFSCGNGG
jgi:hypothetical protein